MKILIISAFFPPLNSIACLRPYSWAKQWSKNGHCVSVLTIPKELSASSSPMTHEGLNVIEVPIPGFLIAANLLGMHDEKEISGIKHLPKNSIKSKLQTAIRKTRHKFQAKYGVFSSCRMPDTLDIWAHTALKKVNNEQWDLVVSTAGPYSVHAPAYALRRSGKAKRWIADWRDLWVDNHIYPGLPGFRLIESVLEKRWSKHADIITTVSPVFAKTLSKKYGNKVKVIYNGFDAEDYANLPEERIFENDGLTRIVYTGTIYPKNNDLNPLFEAVSQLHHTGKINNKQIKFIFCGRNTDFSELARNKGILGYFDFLGLVPRKNALRMQRDATTLLFLEFESSTTEGVLSGKIFEYLFAGPQVISLGMSQNSSVAKLLVETRKGVSILNEINEIKKQILRLKDLENDLDSDVNNKINLDFFSRQHQADEMLRLAIEIKDNFSN